jgi:hypothetical protein
MDEKMSEKTLNRYIQWCMKTVVNVETIIEGKEVSKLFKIERRVR